MPTVHDFIEIALAQKGDRYVFGAEAGWNDPDPDEFDCSELVEWASHRVGLSPPQPDGAFNQWAFARQHGLLIPVKDAYKTAGTLLFVGDGTGGGRNAIHHVAISLGNGYTIEARGRRWGVGVFSVQRRFNYAARVLGLDYRSAVLPAKAQPRTVLKAGDKGKDVLFAQAMFNIIIPAIKPYGFTNGQPLKTTAIWDAPTQSVNKSFEAFWNQYGAQPGKKLQVDTIWTMAGTGPAVTDFVTFLNTLKK